MSGPVSGKSSLRVLLFLRSVRDVHYSFFDDGKAKRTLLVSNDDPSKKLLCSSDTLNALQNASLVAVKDGRCVLQPTGLMRVNGRKSLQKEVRTLSFNRNIES